MCLILFREDAMILSPTGEVTINVLLNSHAWSIILAFYLR